MSKTLEAIDDEIISWIQQQHLFFVATAPTSLEAHINCSPKGLDSFRVLGSHEVAYLDYTGSGAETIAHLRENGRVVLMFCAFDGKPNIVRFHGVGTPVFPLDPEFKLLADRFAVGEGVRAVIRVKITRISSSCGFGVPLMEYVADREALPKWARHQGPAALADYRALKNATSIDGLPALDQ